MKISIGLLSWKRVSNIRKIVDEYIFHDDLIDEIIIWNNNPEEHIEFGDGYDIVKVINCQNPIDRKLCGLILHEYWNLSEGQRALIHSKGDDILASYVVTHYTGQTHLVHNIPFTQLDESYALHYGKSRPVKPMTKQHQDEIKEWTQYRTEMMRFCKGLYE